MKILMVSTDSRILKPGPVQDRMKAYGSLGEELHIIVIASRDSKVLAREREIVKIASNVWVYPLAASSRIAALVKVAAKGRKIVSKSGADDFAVVSQDPFEQGIAGYLISLMTGAILQLQVHTDFLSPYYKNESMLNALRVKIAKYLLPRAKLVRAVSDRIKDSIVADLGIPTERIAVLPIYTDVQEFSSSAPVAPNLDLHKKYPQFGFIILVASRLTREKDIPTAVKAFAQFYKDDPRAGLVIVGAGPLLESLKKLVSELGLEKAVVFESWQKELRAHYKTADVLLVSSLYEGYGLTMIEAASCGCPVVTTNVGIADKLVIEGHNGYVCDVKDISCLARGLAQTKEKGLKIRLLGQINPFIETLPNITNYLEQYKKSLTI